MKEQKRQKGITLVALIITIVVMMILVAVSVTVALQSGLFSAASGAANDMRYARENEIGVSAGKVTVEGTQYNSMQEYVDTLGGNAGSEADEQITVTVVNVPFSVEKGSTWGEAVASINEQFMKGCGANDCEGSNGPLLEWNGSYLMSSFIGAAEGPMCSCGKLYINFGLSMRILPNYEEPVITDTVPDGVTLTWYV